MNIMINLLAVLVSAVANMLIGSIWYGPLFGKKFMEAMDFDKLSKERQDAMKKGMILTYLWQFFGSIVMFYVFAWIMNGLNQMSVLGGLHLAFWIWLGFIVPLKLSDALWGGKMILFWLSICYMLLSLLAAGAIIGAWN